MREHIARLANIADGADKKLGELIAANPGVPIRVRFTPAMREQLYWDEESRGSREPFGHIVHAELGDLASTMSEEYPDRAILEERYEEKPPKNARWESCIIVYVAPPDFICTETSDVLKRMDEAWTASAS